LFLDRKKRSVDVVKKEVEGVMKLKGDEAGSFLCKAVSD
jgi:hypothetical protein